jgi:hypothetical protein
MRRTYAGMGKLRALTEDELRRINGFLLNVPTNLAVPKGCADQPGVSEKQVCWRTKR